MKVSENRDEVLLPSAYIKAIRTIYK